MAAVEAVDSGYLWLAGIAVTTAVAYALTDPPPPIPGPEERNPAEPESPPSSGHESPQA